jgi:hypothetical protein
VAAAVVAPFAVSASGAVPAAGASVLGTAVESRVSSHSAAATTPKAAAIATTIASGERCSVAATAATTIRNPA